MSESDILRLERLAKKAADAGDINTLRAIDEALKNAREGFTEPAPPPEVPLVGRAGAVGLGAQRGFGRKAATARDIYQLGERTVKGQLGQQVEGQEDIAATERAKEAEYRSATREHPGYAFGGEMIAELPFAAGRTPSGAFLRGATSGGLTYTEDPTTRVAQAILGGAANRLGLGVLGRTNNQNLQSQAARTGMELLPEQRAPTLFPNTVKDFDTYRGAAFRAAERNNRMINKEALRTLGQKGDRFTDETFANVHKQSSDLFNEAVGSRESIFFGRKFNDRIDDLINSQEEKIVRDARSIKALQRLKDRIANNDGSLSAKDYQSIRSELTTSMRQVSPKRKALKRTLGEIVEAVDDQAELSLAGSDAKALSNFKEARRLWRQYNLFKTEGIVDERTGFVNPQRLRKLLRKEDESGFLLNKDQGDLATMLRVDAKTPRGRERFDVLGNYSDMRVVGGPGGGARVGPGIRRVAETPLIGMSRLPQRAIEGAPLATTVPLVRETIPSDTTDKIVNALMSGSDEGLTPAEKLEVDEKRRLISEAISSQQENR